MPDWFIDQPFQCWISREKQGRILGTDRLFQMQYDYMKKESGLESFYRHMIFW